MLEVRGIGTYYGNIPALREVSIDVPEGGVVAILGANGAGKTTLMKTIAGVLRPRSGTVSFLGEEITGLPSHKIVGRGVALRERPQLEGLANRHPGEDRPPLRHQGDASPHDLVGGEAGDLLAEEGDRAGARPKDPGDRLHQRGLSRPVRADDGDDASLGDIDGDLPQGGDAAVIRLDAPDLKHRGSLPRRRGTPRSPADCPGSPPGRPRRSSGRN